MGLFSSTVPRSKWSEISYYISKGFKNEREKWFDFCIQLLETVEEPSFKIINRKIGNDVDFAMRGFQLYLLIIFLEELKYIEPSRGKEFTDLVFAQVCGTELDEIIPYFVNYYKCSELTQLLFTFTLDIAKFIVGEEDAIYAMDIGSTVVDFINHNKMLIAACFGDKKTVEDIRMKLNQ